MQYGGTELRKLSLFKVGKGAFEKRIDHQDDGIADMEIHEHVKVNGLVSILKSPIRHENINSIDRYIQKHNDYSNWEAQVFLETLDIDEGEKLFGNQMQRRRWLKKKFPTGTWIFFSILYSWLRAEIWFLRRQTRFHLCVFLDMCNISTLRQKYMKRLKNRQYWLFVDIYDG